MRACDEAVKRWPGKLITLGAVMAITESDMSRDERGKMALDLIKRFGSKNPEVSGTLGTYRLDFL